MPRLTERQSHFFLFTYLGALQILEAEVNALKHLAVSPGCHPAAATELFCDWMKSMLPKRPRRLHLQSCFRS